MMSFPFGLFWSADDHRPVVGISSHPLATCLPETAPTAGAIRPAWTCAALRVTGDVNALLPDETIGRAAARRSPGIGRSRATLFPLPWTMIRGVGGRRGAWT